MRFDVVCTEEVTTEFSVEAPDKTHLLAWLQGEQGANVVSNLRDSQTVHDRDYAVKKHVGKGRMDFNTEVE